MEFLPLSAQGDDVTPEKIQLGGRWFTYEDAMPLLLQQLEGNNEQKASAAERLQCYGDTLIRTPALAPLIRIVEEKIDFSVLDRRMKPYIKGIGSLPEDLTPEEQELAERSEVKFQALMALVMTGSKDEEARLQRWLRSPSATEQFIALEVRKVQDKYGSWLKGKVPERQPPPRVLLGTKRLKQSEVLGAIVSALDTGEPRAVREALQTLADSGLTLVSGEAGAVDVFKRALEMTRALAEYDAQVRQVREQFALRLLRATDTFPVNKRKEILPFVEAASRDSNRYIAEAAATVFRNLQSISQPEPPPR